MRCAIALACVVCVIGLLAGASAAMQDTRPATGPAANGEHLLAKVAAVKGLVQVRDGEDQAWRAATVGMIVPIGGECRTGPKSSIMLTMPPNQVIVLDRLGVVKILEAFRGQGNFKTDIGMQYGRVRYEVEAAGLEHEAVIRSPSNALAIRGSNGEVLDDGLSFTAKLYRGSSNITNPFHQTVTMGTGPQGDYGNSPVVITLNDVSPANNSENNTNPYKSLSSLTPNEQTAIVNNNSNTASGVTGSFNNFTRPTNPQVVVPPIQKPGGVGTLTFSLLWTGIGESGSLPDLDLFVTPPNGKTLVPGNTVTNIPTGGTVSKNDHGGPNATSGSESATFQPTFPLGSYKYGVTYKGGTDPALFKIQVLQNGRQVNANFDDTVTPLDPFVGFAIDITNQNSSGTTGVTAAAQSAKASLRKPANRNSAPAAVRAAKPAKAAAKANR